MMHNTYYIYHIYILLYLPLYISILDFICLYIFFIYLLN